MSFQLSIATHQCRHHRYRLQPPLNLSNSKLLLPRLSVAVQRTSLSLLTAPGWMREEKRGILSLLLCPVTNAIFLPGWDRRAPPCLKLPTLDLLVQFAIQGVRLSGDMQYFHYRFRNLFLFWKWMYTGCHSRCPCWTTTFSHRVLDHLPGTRLKQGKEGKRRVDLEWTF